MKQLFKPLLMLVFAGTVVSCSKSDKVFLEPDPEIINPITDYKIVPTEDPFTFKFENLSSKYSRLEWRFGDDSLRTDASPTHTYLTTGDFQVDLKAFNEAGISSRKLQKLSIIPDSVMKVTAVPTGVANQVRFALSSKAQISSAIWTFKETTPANTSTSLTPVKTLAPGSFNNFTVKVTTSTGSVVMLDKNVTTAGVADNITLKGIYTPSIENTGNSNENAAKLIDGKLDTKIFKGGAKGLLPLTFQFTYETPQTVKIYAIGSANDSPDRDPKVWTLEGSNDNGQTWEVLNSVTRTKTFFQQKTDEGAVGEARYKALFYFVVENPKPFLMYRWKVTELWGSNDFQISEIRLFR